MTTLFLSANGNLYKASIIDAVRIVSTEEAHYVHVIAGGCYDTTVCASLEEATQLRNEMCSAWKHALEAEQKLKA